MDPNQPHSGPPSGGIPQGNYYNNYPAMQNMQPHSSNQPPMDMNGGYPGYPPQQSQPMCHPAYQTPPQMPGNYRSPGMPQTPQPHSSYVADWINPNAYNYSPVPSVAPSMMSHASVGIPCNGSTMSINSNMYGMDCMTPDMRPESVMSAAPSYSENMDPRFSMIPGMPPPPSLQPQQRQRPTFPQLLENVFPNPNLRKDFIRETMLLAKEVFDLAKSGQKIPESCHKYAQLLPRILFALAKWNINPNEEGQALTRCYERFVTNLPEQSVQMILQPGIIPCERGQDPAGAHIRWLAQAAFSPSYASLLYPLDTILTYKPLRPFLRNDEFLNTVIVNLAKPDPSPQIALREHYLISILNSLATSRETRAKLLEFEPRFQGKMILANGMKGIIPVLFVLLHSKCYRAFHDKSTIEDPKVFQSLKVVRQLIKFLLDIGSAPYSVKIAAQIVHYDGLNIIAGYVHYMYTKGQREDFIVNKGLKLINTCATLNAETSLPLVPNMQQLQNAPAFLEKILDIFVKCEYQKQEDINTVSSLSQILYNVVVGVPNAWGFLSQSPGVFSALVRVLASLYRAQTSYRCSREDKVRWNMYISLLDSQDAVLLIFRKIFNRSPGTQLNVHPEDIRDLFSVVVAQIGDVPTWTELHVVDVVYRTILVTFSMFKTFGKTEFLPSFVIQNTFNRRQENVLASTFLIMRNLLEIFKGVEEKTISISKSVAQKLNLIIPTIFDLISIIWQTYDNPQTQQDWMVLSNMKCLINNYTVVLFKYVTTVEGRDLKRIILFFANVVYDKEIAANWSNCPDLVNYFDSLSSSQDADLAKSATIVQSRISRSPASLSNEIFNAMNYNMMDPTSFMAL